MKKMKSVYLILLTFILISLVSCQTKEVDQTIVIDQTEVDFEKEKKAILEVIDGESTAFWNKDFDTYASYWAHESHVRTMGWWQDGGVTTVNGWDERAKRTKSHMEKSPEPNSTANNVIRKNMNFRIFKDVAWLTFDQYGEDTGDQTMDMPGLSRETRILEKMDGEWKIVYVGWLLEG
jgi:pyocin large subunit-like protein